MQKNTTSAPKHLATSPKRFWANSLCTLIPAASSSAAEINLDIYPRMENSMVQFIFYTRCILTILIMYIIHSNHVVQIAHILHGVYIIQVFVLLLFAHRVTIHIVHTTYGVFYIRYYSGYFSCSHYSWLYC